MKDYNFFRTIRANYRGTPIAVGLALALCSPLTSIAYASDVTNSNKEIEITQQTKRVRGTILDEAGETLIGVSVLVKGTVTGTITDMDGKFSLDVPEGKRELVISYVGYKTQTVTLASSSDIVITLQPDLQALDEVVVIGYGTVKKRDLTGAISTVKNDVITMSPTINPMEALQGRVAGLDITRESAEAGEGIKMQLRGNRSITASGDPLFIIDGMPGDYATLNPNDIESIEILKDASSTAVYGSSGANGVVIITTKKGEEGKMRVNFNAYVGFNGWSTLPTMRSGDSFLDTAREAKIIAGTYIDDADLLGSEVYAAYQRGENIDWQKALLKTATVQNYSVSVSGGTQKTKAYFSLNYSGEDGQYKNNDYKVYSTNIRVDHELSKWMTAGISMQGSHAIRNRVYAKMIDVLTASPFGTLYDEEGNVKPYPVAGNDSQINLLLNEDKSAYRDEKNATKVYVNPYIRITPIKGLTIESRLNGTFNYNTNHLFEGFGSFQFYRKNSKGFEADIETQRAATRAIIDNSRTWNYKWENILTYHFTVANDHDFTFTGVTSYNHNQKDNSKIEVTGITSNEYLWTNLGAITGSKTLSSGYEMSKGMGLMGRLSYSYLGRYLFSASVRHDGSSKLAAGNKWSTFPAFSLGWRISDESFMESTQGWLDNLKLRGGYGETGTAGINPYASWSILSQGNYSLAGERFTTSEYPKTVPNQDLTWERSHNTNIGLDISVLNNRIDLTADYYITKTTGVIWQRDMPITGGGQNASTNYQTNINIASTKNRGIELALNTRNIITKDFTWTSTITYSHSKEKITSLGDGTQDYLKNGNTNFTLSVGSPIHSYYGYKKIGIWQKGEEADAAVFDRKPGDIKIEIPGIIRDGVGNYRKIVIDEETGEEIVQTFNADNKYVISGNDYQIIGHNTPDWTLGFQNTFTYKNFDLSIYMFARFGQMIKYDLMGYYNPKGTTNFPEYFNYWTPDNPSNDFPGLNAEKELKDYLEHSALNYVEGSFFKIKNITLGYTLPTKACRSIGIQNFRLYGTITNPLVVAKSHLLKDYDPETNGSLDFPLTRQLVFGVNVTF